MAHPPTQVLGVMVLAPFSDPIKMIVPVRQARTGAVIRLIGTL